MKLLNIITSLILLTLANNATSQVDWSEFREPDGTIQRLTIDPRITFNSNSGDGVTNSSNLRLQFLSRYTINKVKEREVMNFFIQNNTIFNDNKSDANIDNTLFLNDLFISGDYSYYLKERRGLFLRVTPFLDYNYEKLSNRNGDNFNRFGGDLLIGFGRLENISTVYQAIRLDKNLNALNGADQAQLFEIARALRSLDYNNALDSRMRTVEIHDLYLQTLRDHGYDLSSFSNIANAIDQFRFERPNIRAHGQEVTMGLTQTGSIGNFHDIALTIGGRYAIAINDKWHYIATSEVVLDIIENEDKGFFSISSLITYLPTARTQIQFSQSYFKNNITDNLNLGISGNYFVSPELSVFLNTSFSYSDNDFIGSRRLFSHDMGFKYFFF